MVLPNIMQYLSDLNDIPALTKIVAKIASEVTILRTSSAAQQEINEAHEETIQALRITVAALQESNQALRNTVAAHEETINNLDSKSQVQDKMTTGFWHIVTNQRQRLQTVNETVATLQETVQDHEGAIQAHEGAIQGHEGAIKAHEHAIEDHEHAIETHEGVFATHEESIEYLQTTVNHTRTFVTSIDRTVNENYDQQCDLEDRVSTTEGLVLHVMGDDIIPGDIVTADYIAEREAAVEADDAASIEYEVDNENTTDDDDSDSDYDPSIPPLFPGRARRMEVVDSDASETINTTSER